MRQKGCGGRSLDEQDQAAYVSGGQEPWCDLRTSTPTLAPQPRSESDNSRAWATPGQPSELRSGGRSTPVNAWWGPLDLAVGAVTGSLRASAQTPRSP
jgi:hypothetical protein